MNKIVTVEEAIKLKRDGFNEPTWAFYFKNFNAGPEWILVDYKGVGQFGFIEKEENHNEMDKVVERLSAPTNYQAIKWYQER